MTIRFEPLASEADIQQPEFRHPVTRWESVEAFHSAAEHEDGVHVIGDRAGHQIELLTGGNPFEAIEGPVLVVFSGAVSKREERVPPFFSGSNLAASTGHPFVAISDPGVGLTDTMAIAWYAGSSHFDTPAVIREVLSPISRRLGRELWLVGGSAGGFAALLVGHSLPGAPSVFVWNPQTDFVEYGRRFVVDYVKAAFPVSEKELSGPDYQNVVRAVFRHYGRTHSLLGELPSQGPGRLFYLQNATDSHFPVHCRPYLRNSDFTRYGRGVWRRDRDHVIWIADVAPGHTPPSREQLSELLYRLTHTDEDVLTTVQRLDSVDYFDDDRSARPEPLALVAEEIRSRIELEWDGAMLHAGGTLPRFYGGIEWRAILMSAGQAVERSPRIRGLGSWRPKEVPARSRFTVMVYDGFGDEIFRESVPVAAKA
ncbi:hypothetical protein ACXET9_09360 [Brachybacterium sp. DNPG3]